MEKKRRFSLNWVDLVIVLLVLGIVAGAYYKFRVADKTNTAVETTPITYTLAINGIRSATAQQILVGDKLYDSGTGNNVGVITAIDVTDARVNTGMDDGTVGYLLSEDRVDIVIHVSADAIIGADGHYVGQNSHICVGSYVGYVTKYVACPGTVTSIVS